MPWDDWQAQEKKKFCQVDFYCASYLLNNKMPGLEATGAFCCYFSQKSKPVRKGDTTT